MAGELIGRLRKAGRLAGVISPFLTVEEAYLLCKLLRSIDPAGDARARPGADGRRRRSVIRADSSSPRKNARIAAASRRWSPTSRGASIRSTACFRRWTRGEFGGVWVSGGYKTEWIDAATAGRFGGLPLLIVQDLFPSPLSELAACELPAAAFAEKDGSYVNRYDRLQTVGWAIRPPQGVRPEGELLWEMLGGRGLYLRAERVG